jgi:hypothetical protein
MIEGRYQDGCGAFYAASQPMVRRRVGSSTAAPLAWRHSGPNSPGSDGRSHRASRSRPRDPFPGIPLHVAVVSAVSRILATESAFSERLVASGDVESRSGFKISKVCLILSLDGLLWIPDDRHCMLICGVSVSRGVAEVLCAPRSPRETPRLRAGFSPSSSR